MIKFFLLMDQMTCWGAGQTKHEAIRAAAQRLFDENGAQGVSCEWVTKQIVSEAESEKGKPGFYIYPVSNIEWPANASELNSDQWYCIYWQQEALLLD